MRTALRHILAVAMLLLLVGGGALHAQDVTAKQQRKERLEKEIAELDRQLKDNASRGKDATYSLTLTRKKISSRKELIAENDREIASLDRQVRGKQQQIDSLQSRLDTMTYYYHRLVKSAYKNRDSRVWYMYIIASENIAQGLRRFSFLKNLSHEMNVQGERINATKAELEVQKAELLALKKQAQSLRAERVKEMGSLQKEEAESQSIIASLKKDKARYQRQLANKKQEVQTLSREIKRLIAEQMKGTSGGKKGSKPVDYTLGKEFSSNKGKLPWPAEGPVVETYGEHAHPVYKITTKSEGISIAVAKGTQAKAVFDGVVARVIVMQGYNKCVLVQHGNYFTFYCKLGSVSVKAGDKVKTGQALGTVDVLGGVSQLHFQLWDSSGPCNPSPWLRPR